jgi:hypothetical protein
MKRSLPIIDDAPAAVDAFGILAVTSHKIIDNLMAATLAARQ